MNWLLVYGGYLRLAFFLGVLAVMALWETVFPHRYEIYKLCGYSRGWRWLVHFAVAVINTVVVRLLVPGAALGVALWARHSQFGLFSLMDLPGWVTCMLALLILDLAIYAQHVMFHAVPLFWRFHRVHHVDRAFDVTTALRFHPLEIVVSLLVKTGVVVLWGIPPVAVIIFEVVLNGMAMFNHSNIAMPRPVERVLRALLVTPAMHRIHHSRIYTETNSNYGFNLSVWDRLFKTYCPRSLNGDNIRFGLEDFADKYQNQTLGGLMAIPFQKPHAAQHSEGQNRKT